MEIKVSIEQVCLLRMCTWGDVDVITTVTNPAEFFATFYPNEFDAAVKDYTTYRAILALLNKPIFTKGGLKIVRVGATSQVKAFKTDTGTGTVTCTAKCFGALGNQIKRQWTAATDLDALKRNLVITIGSQYSATYENLTVANVDQVDDPFVTVTKNTLTVFPVAGSAEALATGSDGAAVAGDYVGSGGSEKGIQLFYGESVKVSVLFVAECPSALLNAVNAGLEAYVQACDKGLVVLCTVDGQTSANAITYVADYPDDRLVYVWPRVKTTNFFDPNVAEIEVDGNAFAAAAIANVDAWLSPGGAGGAKFLTGITGLETEATSRTTMDALSTAGVVPWFMSTAMGGAILYRGRTTAVDGTRIFRRRMTDYLMDAIGGFAEHYVETQLDLVLSDQVLGPNTGGFIAAVQRFLGNERSQTHLQSFSVDPWSQNTQEDIDGGRWTTYLAVKLYSMAEEIVLKAEIGETVTISE